MTLTFNRKIPLAASYNERGQAGWFETENARDQRKINTMYEIAVNAATGKKTLYLTKRPGIAFNTNAAPVNSSHRAYFVAVRPGLLTNTNASAALVSKYGASTVFHTSTVVSSSNAWTPSFWSRTTISGADTIVLQLSAVSVTSAIQAFHASSIGTHNTITSSVFTGLIHRGQMEHIDGFAFQLDHRNRIYNTDLNTLDVWTENAYMLKSIQQDIPVGLARYNKQLLAFGNDTMEVFFNAGNPSGSPLNSVPSLMARVGLAYPLNFALGKVGTTLYYATLGNRLYFIGTEAGTYFSSRGVYAYNGQTVEKVSTPFIDKQIGNTFPLSVSKVGVNGQDAIALQMDDMDVTPNRWLMFFPAYNEWFEWESYSFGPLNYEGVHAGINNATTFGLYHFVATINRTNDSTVSSAVTTAITMTHQFQMPGEDGERSVMQAYGVTGDTVSSQTTTLQVAFSDDDTTNYVAAGNINMGQETKYLTRGGSYYKRMVRLTHSEDGPCRLTQFIARVV